MYSRKNFANAFKLCHEQGILELMLTTCATIYTSLYRWHSAAPAQMTLAQAEREGIE